MARAVSSQMDFTDLKVNFCPSPPNLFKIAHTIFGVITFQDFALPCLQNDTFDLQTKSYSKPVLQIESAIGRYNAKQGTKRASITLSCI